MTRRVKLTRSCPRWTRTFLLQQVLTCGLTSARTDILSRYGKFCRGLKTSVCPEVRVLFNLVSRDLQNVTAKNIKLVQDSALLDPREFGTRRLKEELHRNEAGDVPEQDMWKVAYLSSLLRQLLEAELNVQDDKTTSIQRLIISLVI